MIGFNLSTYYYTDRRITCLLLVLLSLAVASFSLYNYYSYLPLKENLRRSSGDVSRLRGEIALLKREAAERLREAGGKRGAREIDILSRKIEGINAILERKGFSWSELLYSLEKASNKNVSITRIRPSYGDKKVRLSGVAKGLSDITALLDNLQETEYIRKSYLMREEALLIDKKYPAVSFEIESEGKF